jgi:hypothetical protein
MSDPTEVAQQPPVGTATPIDPKATVIKTVKELCDDYQSLNTNKRVYYYLTEGGKYFNDHLSFTENDILTLPGKLEILQKRAPEKYIECYYFTTGSQKEVVVVKIDSNGTLHPPLKRGRAHLTAEHAVYFNMPVSDTPLSLSPPPPSGGKARKRSLRKKRSQKKSRRNRKR